MTQDDFPFIPYVRPDVSAAELEARSAACFARMDARRSVRDFADRPVPRAVVENLLRTANTAPSGANKQPWTFCAVADSTLKADIRRAAEEEEQASYNGRMPESWLRDLAPLGTDWRKPFLEIAPWLIVVFKRIYEFSPDGPQNNYYVNESVGLACGFLLAAVHEAGLVALTHTPSPMNFLTRVLERPANERPFLLIPVGYPAVDARVPDIRRKAPADFIVWR